MTQLNSPYPAYLVMAVAHVFTWIPLVLFAGFLFLGPFMSLNFQFNLAPSIFFNTLVSFIFFFQHSLMIRTFFYIQLEKWVPHTFHKAFFAIVSGLTLVSVIFLWQPTEYEILMISGSLRWVMRGVFFLSIAGFLWSGLVLKELDTSGVKSIKRHLNNQKQGCFEFTVTGPYQWVRHPLYFFTLLMIWSFPDITADRLLFNLLWSAWIRVGAHLEEKDLVKTIGDQYRQYQKQVPMLIPKPGRNIDPGKTD